MSAIESLQGVALKINTRVTGCVGTEHHCCQARVLRAQSALICVGSPLLHSVVNILSLIPSHALIPRQQAGLTCREGRAGQKMLSSRAPLLTPCAAWPQPTRLPVSAWPAKTLASSIQE